MVSSLRSFLRSHVSGLLTDDSVVGGHSLRVTGAQFLAGLGIEISVIMLMARWKSSVVLHYAREAPLLGLSSAVKERLLSAARPEAVVQDIPWLRADLDKMQERLVALEGHISRGQGYEYVRNLDTRICHRVAVGPPTTDPKLWRSKCGWRFLLSSFEFLGAPPPAQADLPNGGRCARSRCFAGDFSESCY